MKRLLFAYPALLGLALLTGSCAATRPAPADQPLVVNYASPAALDSTAQANRQAELVRSIFEGHPPVVQLELEAMPDSLPFVKVERQPSRLARLFGAKPSTAVYLGQPHVSVGKHSTVTINQVQGNQTNTSTSTAKNGRTVVGNGASNIEADKKAGPITQAAPGAQVHVATSKKGPAQAGEGNVATSTKGSTPWWLWLLLLLVVVGIIYKVSKKFTPT